MQYLYNNAPKPMNATGVPVTITVTDPSGNTQTIGTARSDIGGTYAIAWTPPVEGLYKVVANFYGTFAYYDSMATTNFVVSSLPNSPATPFVTQSPTVSPSVPPTATLSPSPSQAVQPPTSGMPISTYIAIGAAVIIIVAIAAALILRRRK